MDKEKQPGRHIHCFTYKKSVLQNQPKLKPINWYEGINPKEIQERMIHFIELQTTEFRKYRFEYLKTLTEIAQCENSLVDIRKNEIEKENTCIWSNTLCNSVYVNCKWKCNLCGPKVTKNISKKLPVKPKQSSTSDKYLNLGQTKCSNNKPSKIGESILLNPNSYESIEYIVKSLKENLILDLLGIGHSLDVMVHHTV